MRLSQITLRHADAAYQNFIDKLIFTGLKGYLYIKKEARFQEDS